MPSRRRCRSLDAVGFKEVEAVAYALRRLAERAQARSERLTAALAKATSPEPTSQAPGAAGTPPPPALPGVLSPNPRNFRNSVNSIAWMNLYADKAQSGHPGAVETVRNRGRWSRTFPIPGIFGKAGDLGLRQTRASRPLDGDHQASFSGKSGPGALFRYPNLGFFGRARDHES